MNGSRGSPWAGMMGIFLGAVSGSIMLIAVGSATGAVTARLLGDGVSESSLFGAIFGGIVGAAAGAVGGWAGGSTDRPTWRSALVAVIIVTLGALVLLGGWVSPGERAFLLAWAVVGTLASWSFAVSLTKRMIRGPAAGDRVGAKAPATRGDLGE